MKIGNLTLQSWAKDDRPGVYEILDEDGDHVTWCKVMRDKRGAVAMGRGKKRAVWSGEPVIFGDPELVSAAEKRKILKAATSGQLKKIQRK